MSARSKFLGALGEKDADKYGSGLPGRVSTMGGPCFGFWNMATPFACCGIREFSNFIWQGPVNKELMALWWDVVVEEVEKGGYDKYPIFFIAVPEHEGVKDVKYSTLVATAPKQCVKVASWYNPGYGEPGKPSEEGNLLEMYSLVLKPDPIQFTTGAK